MGLELRLGLGLGIAHHVHYHVDTRITRHLQGGREERNGGLGVWEGIGGGSSGGYGGREGEEGEGGEEGEEGEEGKGGEVESHLLEPSAECAPVHAPVHDALLLAAPTWAGRNLVPRWTAAGALVAAGSMWLRASGEWL